MFIYKHHFGYNFAYIYILIIYLLEYLILYLIPSHVIKILYDISQYLFYISDIDRVYLNIQNINKSENNYEE